jgi:hypothetical protein
MVENRLDLVTKIKEGWKATDGWERKKRRKKSAECKNITINTPPQPEGTLILPSIQRTFDQTRIWSERPPTFVLKADALQLNIDLRYIRE